MKALAALAVLALAGCGTPQTVYKPVRAEVPVTVPCQIPAIEKPQFATHGITSKHSLVEQVRALIVTEKQRDGYEALLESAVQSCQ